MKLPKDARATLRYNSELVEKLKEKGWTLQKLLDWAIEQNTQAEIKIKAEKRKG